MLVLVLLLIPLGIDIGYCEGDVQIYLRVSCFTISIYPRDSKSKPKKQNKKDKKKTNKAFPDVTKDEVLDAIEVCVRSVRKLRFHLHRLKLHFISGFTDPYQTAMVYGYANAAIQAFALPQLKRSDIQLGIDFERENCYVDGYLSVTIKIYYIFKLVCCMIGGFLPILIGRHKRVKNKENNSTVKGKVA